MTCSDFADEVVAWDEGLLDEASASRLEAHLATCPECRGLLAETRDLVGRLSGDERGRSVGSLVAPVMDQIAGRTIVQARRRAFVGRVSRAAAASIVIALGVGYLAFGPSRPGARVYAADLKEAKAGMENAATATWKVSYYERLYTKDGRSSRWFRNANNEQRYTYKAPGMYRREDLSPDGKLVFVAIEDRSSGARIEINHLNKTAVTTTLGMAFESQYHPKGPFATYLGAMESADLILLPSKKIDGADAIGFRKEPPDGTPYPYDRLAFDFWLGAQTKTLVQCRWPSADVFDESELSQTPVPFPIPSDQGVDDGGRTYFRALETLQNPANSGHVFHDIAFGPPVDDALFQLVAPEGYVVKAAQPPRIVETDVTEFLGVVADFFDGNFPDRFPHFSRDPEASKRYAKAERTVLTKANPSAAETALIEAMRRWYATGIPGPGPVHVFLRDQVAPGSWKYLGKGVKRGDKDRIVAWYRLKNTSNYRVIHGDLSIKDASASELPLPVSP
ncbi:MAG: zf-HC2 domain-containing protein [Paludisphaera borealis]|uniref:anti-sigma factor family protein n=1 Tax=Paludisphaera borealis TaxID=1387353 RepID=UPI00283CCF79|nr:zf-HC2 domain-containing protein [Paludisphaera borealis]MDR3619455.1 zf-HC2 domain-containing protein [Paludisphaera borealis]